jgi:sugar phosphate isomerase/epimerase
VRLVTPSGGVLWLAYGMNVHPGGSPDDALAAIEGTVLPLRARLGASGDFGVALRLDRAGVDALATDDARRARFRAALDRSRLVPFTANAFVVGDFHADGAKADVHRPTWRERARLDYTLAFAGVMAALRGPGEVVSISTSPGSFKPFERSDGAAGDVAENLALAARALVALEHATGTRVLLGLEPEPLGLLEVVDEVTAFFRGPLEKALGSDRAARRHLGVCYDVCHQAVEHEDPVHALDALAAAGVPVVKVQASSALVLPDPTDAAGRHALARFDEPRWLHQVVSRRGDGALRRAADLPDALAGPDAARWRAERSPWRVHFHVPVHRQETIAPLATTRPDLERALRRVARGDVTSHVEIETYTWEGLPPEARAGTLVESLAREYEWVLSVLQSEGVRRAEGS